MVTFSKEDNIYKVARNTGNRINLLGISFAEKNSSDKTIEVVEWYFPETDRSQIRTSKEEVLNQVLSGLKPLNEDLGTAYQVSKIYYVPSEDGSNLIYQTLFRMLLKHYHSGNEFKENRYYHNRTIGFFKQGNIYKITRITGNGDDIFGISFAEKNSSEDKIEVVEWDFSNTDSRKIQTSKEEVLNQVLSGLKWVNKNLKTNYQLSKIYYVPSEDISDEHVYSTFLRWLITYYHHGNEFQEI